MGRTGLLVVSRKGPSIGLEDRYVFEVAVFLSEFLRPSSVYDPGLAKEEEDYDLDDSLRPNAGRCYDDAFCAAFFYILHKIQI
jgi:hypothetical protein